MRTRQRYLVNLDPVLIVDHEVNEFGLLTEVFRQIDLHIRVHFFEDPKLAFKMLSRKTPVAKPKVILIHHHIIFANALSLLRELNDVPDYRPIKKLIWGEPQEQGFRDVCRQMGALDYFARPQQPSSLKATILKMLASSGVLMVSPKK